MWRTHPQLPLPSKAYKHLSHSPGSTPCMPLIQPVVSSACKVTGSTARMKISWSDHPIVIRTQGMSAFPLAFLPWFLLHNHGLFDIGRLVSSEIDCIAMISVLPDTPFLMLTPIKKRCCFRSIQCSTSGGWLSFLLDFGAVSSTGGGCGVLQYSRRWIDCILYQITTR